MSLADAFAKSRDGCIRVTIAMADMSRNDEVVPGAMRSEELRLIRAFLRLTDAGRRQKVLEWAERLADEAGSATEAPAFVATDPSAAASIRDFPGPTE